ncbi:MAG: NAD(P)-dependent oxidoreductase [Bacteroidota bacterium]
MKKILFLDSTHPILSLRFEEAGYVVEHDYTSTKEEVMNKIMNYFGVIIRSRFIIDKPFIEASSQLKFIGRVGAGLENIDLEYASFKNIQCINSPEGNRDAVAEHTLGMLLCLANNIVKANNEVKNGLWLREANRGFEIKGKTIAIIGFGNMGSAFAQRLIGFEAKVIAYDKYKSNFSSAIVEECTMEKVFNEADIVSFHVPYNSETHFLFEKKYINQFRKSIYLLNTSRGKVVKTDDLVEALKQKKVLGAALDVLEYESVALNNKDKEQWSESMNFLAMAQNVILTPHIAGWTVESNIKLSTIIADKVTEIFK